MTPLIVIASLAFVTLGYLVVRLSTDVAPPPDDGCTACGSTLQRALGPGAYRCESCGYEGGPGLASLRASKLMLRHAALDPEARTRAIFDDLSFAGRQLLTAADRLDQLGAEWIELGEDLSEP